MTQEYQIMKWIDVNDKLPEYDVVVIAMLDRKIGIGKRVSTDSRGERWRFENLSDVHHIDPKITKWMPFPFEKIVKLDKIFG